MAVSQIKHDARALVYHGVIKRIDSPTECVLEETGSSKQYSFTMDKVTAYQGQSISTLSSFVGRPVKFIRRDDEVTLIELTNHLVTRLYSASRPSKGH